jgi:exodeoxyribonuclease VII large subunit
VQGAQAPPQIIKAIEYFNELSSLVDILVITRGGGSAEDLAAFSDERVVRAVAASRIPTLVAVGHEVDVSLAELAADLRASTPTNAAQLAVPNRSETITGLAVARKSIKELTVQHFQSSLNDTVTKREYLTSQVNLLLSDRIKFIHSHRKLVSVFDPRAALKRGYAIISRAGQNVSSVKGLKTGDWLDVQLADGKIGAKVQ